MQLNRRRKLLLAVSALVLVRPGGRGLPADQGSGSEAAIVLRATVLPHERLCDIKELYSFPLKYSLHKDSRITIAACGNLQEKHGSMRAVRVTLTNSGSSEVELPFNLTTVTVRTKSGKVLPALAVRAGAVRGFGGAPEPFFYWEDIVGTAGFPIEAGKAIDLVFVFPQASPGDTLRFGQVRETTMK